MQDAAQEEEKREEALAPLAQPPNLGLALPGGGPNEIRNIEEVSQEQSEIAGT